MKFLFDRFMAFVGLLLLSPVLLAVAILIKVKMPDGAVIFKQKRVGRNAKLFTMYKFRSMSVGHGGSSVSVAGESRITQLGAKLRKYKLDELPELWNVLIGDMSFVGPRPDVPGYADKLVGEDRLILKLRPGITGPASLKYANEEEILAKVDDPVKYNDEVIFPDKVKINLDYYYHHSFIGDIKLIFKTKFGIRAWDTFTLKGPKIGDLVMKSTVARFTRTFGTLLASGVPILDALQITQGTIKNSVVAGALQRVHDRVRDGEGLSTPLTQQKLFPSMVTSMIEVGEETGQLPEMLNRVADNYDEEVDNAVGSITAIIEPIMIVFMAIVVGTIVIALFLPIIQIIQKLTGGA